MADTGIIKRDAARRQLDCAIRLLFSGEDSLAIHTLAFAAYCILRDLLGKSQTREVFRQFEKSQKLGEIPKFLKHAVTDPHAYLNKHSEKSAHLTLAAAVRLWKEHGNEETPDMRRFSESDDPFKPGHRASGTFKLMQDGISKVTQLTLVQKMFL